MAEYYNGTTHYNNENEVRRAYPNTSISFSNLPDGLKSVLPTPKPAPSTSLKIVSRNGVTTDGLGNYVYAWIERDMFTADILDIDGVTVLKTIAEQEAEYLADVLQKYKDTKCAEIDKQTADAITEIAGDSVKQRNSMMEYMMAKEVGADVTNYLTLANQVKALRDIGNTKEAEVQACIDIAAVDALGY